MAETGAEPAQTVMIGDTTYDMVMARGAHVTALGVAWGYHTPEALRAAHYVHVQNKQLQEVLKLALHVPEPAKGANKKLAEWYAEADVLDLFHKKQVDAVEAKAKPEITEQVFASNGYELVEDTEKNGKNSLITAVISGIMSGGAVIWVVLKKL